MLKKIAIAILVIVVLIVGVSFLLPSKIYLERETTIKAPPAVIYPYLANFRKFNEWSPWAKLDPNLKYVYSGPEHGIGAKSSWDSEDPQVGKGSQETIEMVENKSLKNRLTFDGDESFASYTLTPNGDSTKVVWSFETDVGMNPMGKYMGLIIEKMLAPSYEEGLKSLKELVEKKSS